MCGQLRCTPWKTAKYFAFLYIATVGAFLIWGNTAITAPTHRPTQGPLIKNTPVCMLGNAQNLEFARKRHEQWRTFPSFWAVWNYSDDSQIEENSLPKDFHWFRCEGTDCPWSVGIHKAYKYTKEHSYVCEYYFTCDDDSEWSLDPLASQATLDRELLYQLRKWVPAVAAFPWDFADTEMRAMEELKAKYEGLEVQPLTAYDNGNALYHHSIIDFILPFSPNGEGGFYGHWTLPAEWLNLFIPRTFKRNAIRFNTLTYKNKININTNSKGEPVSSDKLEGHQDKASGDWISDTARHPYEWPRKQKYANFIQAGMKVRYYGVQMEASQVTWEVEVGHPPFNVGLLNKMKWFYKLDHLAITEHHYLGNAANFEALTNTTHKVIMDDEPQTFSVILLVFAYNRMEPLKRLMDSLLRADYLDQTVKLKVFLDLNDATRDTIRSYLDGIKWEHGPYEIVLQDQRKGLKRSILDAWDPYISSEYAVFLEDDVEVSQFFYRWVDNCIKSYAPKPGSVRNDHLLGCSLYNPIFAQVDDKFHLVHNKHEPYILQDVCSWGAVYFPTPWKNFKNWLDENWKSIPNDVGPLVPHSRTNRWPATKSWKKFFIRQTVEEGNYMVYPNLPHNYTLSTNHMEPGANDKGSGLSAPRIAKERFTLELLEWQNNVFRLLDTKPLESLQVYDFWRHRVDSVASLKNEDTFSFDHLTLIMPTYKRDGLLKDTLMHYNCIHEIVHEIVVVWNNDYNPPDLSNLHLKNNIRFRISDKNSLNNKFINDKKIKTEAVFTVDDDIRVKCSDLIFAFRAWQMNPNRHVGFRFSTRAARRVVDEKVQDVVSADCQDDRDWRGPDYCPFWSKIGECEGNPDFMKMNCQKSCGLCVGEKKTAYKWVYEIKAPPGLHKEHMKSKENFEWNIVLTGSSIFATKFLEMYSSDLEKFQQIRTLVDRDFNGEDIAFSFLIADMTKQGPLVVEAAWDNDIMTYGEKGGKGLWMRKGHFEQRGEIIERLVKIFGGMMLRICVGVSNVNGQPRLLR